MRVNVYAEEMTNRVEIISKEIDGQSFTGLRLYLELPAAFVPTIDGGIRPATPEDETVKHLQAPFIHRPGDDDSSAVTFWGKRDLRDVLKIMLAKLDEHYAERDKARAASDTDKFLVRSKERIAAEGRIAVGSDIHLLEMAVTEITRLRTVLAASEKDKAALALAAAAMREQAAKACKREVDSQKELAKTALNVTTRTAHEHKVIMARHLRSAILAIPLPDPTTISAQVDALVRAAQKIKAAFSEEELYSEDSELTEAQSEAVLACYAALQPLRDAGFGGGETWVR